MTTEQSATTNGRTRPHNAPRRQQRPTGSKRRYYQAGVREALFMLSRGRCYVPTCSERVLRMVDGDPSINIQIAHICAHSDEGPRFDPKMLSEERASFKNLILLCQAHHRKVDDKTKEAKYPKALLLEWKTAREGDFGAQLEGLDILSKDDLEEMLISAITDSKEEILGAIDEVAQISQNTAKMLRKLVAETFDRPYLDLDAIASLADSARMLSGLEDNASLLHSAAHMLGNLEDDASSLRSAAQSLGNLEDNASRLQQAAGMLGGLEDNASSLASAAGRVSTALSEATTASMWDTTGADVTAASRELSEVVSRLEQAAQSAESNSYSYSPVVQTYTDQRWHYFKIGFGTAVFVAITITIAVLVLTHHGH